MFVNKKVAALSLDSGCEGDCITISECKRLNIPVIPLDASDNQVPTQADGQSPLQILGKAKFESTRDKVTFMFDGYVTANLQSPILCGGPFLERNQIVQELHKRRIVIAGKYYIEETSPFCPNPNPTVEVSNISWSTPALALSKVEFALPGEKLQLQLDPACLPDTEYIVAPTNEELLNKWHPQVIRSENGKFSISNTSTEVEHLAKHTPVFNIQPVTRMNNFIPNPPSNFKTQTKLPNLTPADLSKIQIDASVPKHIQEKLNAIHKRHEKIFDGNLREGYNGFAGDFMVDFNFLNDVPPPISYGCVPSYNKPSDDDILQAMIDKLEENNIVAKANQLNIIPKFASPCMLVKKNSVRNLATGEYDKLPTSEKIKYNRFVLCMNKLNDHVQKIPAKYNKLEDTIRMVGSFEYVITSDLTDSFWQRHITESKLPYFAFHSPFRGTFIFLRSTQGFLNQSEGLEEMLSCVLQDGISQGWCRVHADNLYVMGHTVEETVENWQKVLDSLMQCNLKLSPKKTSCFPAKLDLLGWTKEGKFLVPDVHRQNCLEEADLPSTVKELRSYLGSYRTFYRCKEGISLILGDMEELVAGKPSTQKVSWTENLIKTFENSKKEVKKLDRIYLPKPNDQLVLTSDYSKKGIAATLWAVVDGKFFVVARMSTKLDKAQENLLPCEGEATAQYVAGKCPYINTYILASNLKTISLLDNKPTVQASNLLKQGKFSSSKLINQVLTAISELNMDFQHISGKMGQNFVDDFGSRHPTTCSDPDKCNICNFVKDCAELTVGPISFSVSQTSVVGQITLAQVNSSMVNDIIRGIKTIPFGNRQAMRYLQDQDPVLQRVRELLVAGEGPKPKEKLPVKRYLQKTFGVTLAKDGCLVVNKRGKQFVTRQLIVIPENLSSGLLYGLHWNLNHPSAYQLIKAVDTKFFLLDRDKKIRVIVDSCALCQSVKNIPEEIHTFQPNQIPDHPGKAFTVDVLRTCSKKIMVTVDNFSGFVITDFINTEKHKDLLDCLIKTITPFKSSSLAPIRVDQAPGFQALFKRKAEAAEAGIELDLGDVKNKNATAIVDKKMQELEMEIKKCSPAHNVLDVKILAKATTAVNEKIRNQGLSAKEILFSRYQLSSDNLYLEDNNIVDTVMENRKLNNEYSSKSKAAVQRKASSANAKEGQLVFLKHDGEKLRRRDLYLVLSTDRSQDTATVCKVLDAFSDKPASIHPHRHVYNVKQTEIYLAPNQPEIVHAEMLQPEWYYPLDDHSTESFPSTVQCDQPEENNEDFWIFEASAEPGDEDSNAPDSEDDQPTDTSTYDASEEKSEITLASEENDEHYEYIAAPPDPQADPFHAQAVGNEQHDDDLNVLDIEEPNNPMYDEELGDLRDLTLNPSELPLPGQRIVFWDSASNSKLKAQVTLMFKTVQKKWPRWRNIRVDGSPHQSSINLDINDPGCVRWMFTEEVVPQIDGNYTTATLASSGVLPEIDFESENVVHSVNREFLRPPDQIRTLNLEIPASNQLRRDRVYRLPDVTTRATSQQLRQGYDDIGVQEDNGEHDDDPQERTRSRMPNFVKKIKNYRRK